MLSGVSAILSLALLPAFCSASSSAQVYLHPPLSSTAQSTSPAQASALLAHHLRLDAFFPSVSSEPHGEIVLGGSRAFAGEGARDALLLSVDASHPEDVIPEPLRPSFKLSTASTPVVSLLEQYTRVAWRQYHAIFDTPSSSRPYSAPALLDIFSLAISSSPKSDVLEKFLGSLSAVVSFVEESRTDDENGDRFGAFDVTGLLDIEKEWGRESDVYQSAAATLKATIQSAASKALSFAVILSPQTQLHARQPPQSPLPSPPPNVPDTAPIFSTSTCFTTASACLNATSSCSSRGKCVGATRAGRTCFVCECGKAPLEEGGKNVSWAGGMCQKKDISQQFTLIAGTVIFLIMISFGSIALLYTVGDQELPGTLTGGMGGHVKHD